MSLKLKVGDKAPAFSGQDQDSNIVKLSDYKGKKVALYFYPHDNTPSCTVQACNLRDHEKELAKKNITILGVSTDTVKSHKKFEAKYRLPFRMIADVDMRIANKYGVWQWKKFMGHEYEGIVRTTFLINEKGVIEHIIDKVKTKSHTEQILDVWS